MIRAYRMLSAKVPYPLHLGVTEAGPPSTGSIKSAVGLGALLADGIGDTIRVSLTADPVEEVKVAWEILKALGLRERGPILIACPSCGRDNVGVQQLAEEVEERLARVPAALRGRRARLRRERPGRVGRRRLRHRRRPRCRLHLRARQVLRKVESEILVDELFHEIDRWIAAGMPRPERRKMAKPAALAMAEASAIPLE